MPTDEATKGDSLCCRVVTCTVLNDLGDRDQSVLRPGKAVVMRGRTQDTPQNLPDILVISLPQEHIQCNKQGAAA